MDERAQMKWQEESVLQPNIQKCVISYKDNVLILIKWQTGIFYIMFVSFRWHEDIAQNLLNLQKKKSVSECLELSGSSRRWPFLGAADSCHSEMTAQW